MAYDRNNSKTCSKSNFKAGKGRQKIKEFEIINEYNSNELSGQSHVNFQAFNILSISQ